ncbi:C-C motif chemokine 20-like [Brienomyrus brachyistius]|uniref:C-C motif chemokine 20-like n=1 Tax=Brienomyrus brachyistius TaxID=42636 RepID=UPI0020B262AC|nr:C-C motif chemokine 20-like [Brienomyrus brachyistius]
MAAATLFSIAFVFLCCLYITQGQLAVDCCLKVGGTKIPKHIVRGYIRQTGGEGCDISAVVFITKKNRRLCAPPAASWVEDLISYLQEKREGCIQNKFRDKWCKNFKL